MDVLLSAYLIVAFALAFDFLNGFHDAANAVATIVVTRTLSPLQAVFLAGAANFAGYFIFGVAVAETVGKGIIVSEYVTLQIIFSALLGAIVWNILTWFLGLPTSSSHALIGGLVGSALAAVGPKAVVFHGVAKVASFIIIAPLLGMAGAVIFSIIVIRATHTAVNMGYHRENVAGLFKKLQLVSATLYSIGHGTNDAQKTMGVIALVLFSAGINNEFRVDEWVMLSCQAAIALGTVLGGWRIVKTMGTSITKIRAMEGFCAETSSAAVLLGTAHSGIPVSTTHVIAGSIMGVGTVEHARGVRWVTARKILWAWILTIPATAAFSGTLYVLLSLLH
ncbi:MAG: inorganic phosphate transporter [Candidatus Altiarchaeota archaeon]